MSFSLDVKNELSRIFSEDREAQLAELSALIRTSGTLKIIGLNKLAFSIFTDNIAIARKTFALIKSCFNISIEIQIKKIGTKQSYTLNISYDDGANEILKEVGIIEIEDSYIRLLENLPDLGRPGPRRRRRPPRRPSSRPPPQRPAGRPRSDPGTGSPAPRSCCACRRARR